MTKNVFLVFISTMLLLVLFAYGSNAEVTSPLPPGATESPASDFEYKRNLVFGGIEITKYLAVSDIVRIPEKIEGEPVTVIGNAVFGNAKVTEVTIPDSVIFIDDYAFYRSGLKTIAIPNSVISIGLDVFFGCTQLTSVTMGNKLTAISMHAFSGCYNLTGVVIPASVLDIAESAFSDCYKLTKIDIPATVKHIGKRAFESNLRVEEVERFTGLTATYQGKKYGTRLKSRVYVTKTAETTHEIFDLPQSFYDAVNKTGSTLK